MILIAITILIIFFAILSAYIGYLFQQNKNDNENPLVEKINNCLPQTQCGNCGFPGCKPYANAIANGEAINLCPPGGQETINKLAELLNVDPLSLDESKEEKIPQFAIIDENLCVGCTKCIQVCPVDAIVGAAKLMHTVITDDCVGCNLCPPVCPVDCITMVDVPEIKIIKPTQWNIIAKG